MSSSPPLSLLVTPDARRRLQQRYEEAVLLMAAKPCDHARVHELLGECLRADPGNILYLDQLLANLRSWNLRPSCSWLPGWLRGSRLPATSSQSPDSLLRAAPELLREHWCDAQTLGMLAAAARELHLDEAELRYWQEAVDVAPAIAEVRRGLARSLTCQGRFDEASLHWFQIFRSPGRCDDHESCVVPLLINRVRFERAGKERVAVEREIEAARQRVASEPAELAAYLHYAAALADAARFDEAERVLADARAVGGGNLAVAQAIENLQLARASDKIAIARLLLAEEEATYPRLRELVARLESEHNRLKIDIFHLRSERHPDDLSLRLELARRLKRAGNFSGAIQRLEEALADERLAGEALLELGECWQHLRQFEKALAYYRQAAELADKAGATGGTPRPLVGALYRIGVLAAAMNRPAEATAALARLVVIEPEYKDARQRLDNLP
jgi:tetratricopeptide (TPR) repeat protein